MLWEDGGDCCCREDLPAGGDGNNTVGGRLVGQLVCVASAYEEGEDGGTTREVGEGIQVQF
jgi:hypothetical protein